MTVFVNLLRHLLTGKDNTTHDIGRWSWLGSFIAVVGHSIWSVVHGVAVPIQDLATALSSVAGAHGIALFAKRGSEPEDK